MFFHIHFIFFLFCFRLDIKPLEHNSSKIWKLLGFRLRFYAIHSKTWLGSIFLVILILVLISINLYELAFFPKSYSFFNQSCLDLFLNVFIFKSIWINDRQVLLNIRIFLFVNVSILPRDSQDYILRINTTV